MSHLCILYLLPMYLFLLLLINKKYWIGNDKLMLSNLIIFKCQLLFYLYWFSIVINILNMFVILLSIYYLWTGLMCIAQIITVLKKFGSWQQWILECRPS